MINLLSSMGIVGAIELVLGLLAALVCFGSGIQLVRGKRVLPIVPVAAVSVPVILGLIASTVARSRGVDSLAFASPELKATILATSVAQSLNFRALASFVVILSLFPMLFLTAIAGPLRSPRSFKMAGLGLALVFLVFAVFVGAGIMGRTQWAYPILVGGPAVFAGVLTSVALMASNPDRGGPENAATAAMSFPLLFAGLASVKTVGDLIRVFAALAMLDPAHKLDFYLKGRAEIDASNLVCAVGFGVAVLIGGLGLVAFFTARRKPCIAVLVSLALGACLMWTSGVEDLIATIFTTYASGR